MRYYGTPPMWEYRVGDAGDRRLHRDDRVLLSRSRCCLRWPLRPLVTRRTVGGSEISHQPPSGACRPRPAHSLRGSHDEGTASPKISNPMLDRIETLMGEVTGQRQRRPRFAHAADSAVGWKRPITPPAERRVRGADDTIADLDAVLGMFASITRISEIETRARRSAFRALDLAEIAGEVVELYDAAAEQVATRLSLGGDREVPVTGDRDLLFDAIANLVDNAIKHGRAGGQVTVTCRSAGDGAMIAIADDGPGIPTEARDHVFALTGFEQSCHPGQRSAEPGRRGCPPPWRRGRTA